MNLEPTLLWLKKYIKLVEIYYNNITIEGMNAWMIMEQFVDLDWGWLRE